MTNAKRILGRAPTLGELRLATDALWDNAIDGRNASAADFDAAERALRHSFLVWLAGQS